MCATLLAPLRGQAKVLHSRPVVSLHGWAEFVRLVPHECALHIMKVQVERLPVVGQRLNLGNIARYGREQVLLPQTHTVQSVLCHLPYCENQDV